MNTQKAIIPEKKSCVIQFPLIDPQNQQEHSEQQKLKKDGSPKNIISNAKRGRKSEVYPFQIADLKKVMEYFKSNGMWQHYLIFVIGVNMARRISDTLALQWKHFFNPETGKFRTDLLEIIEDKTDKLANPRINSACREAIELFLKKTGVDPSADNYERYVFMQTSGTHKGNVMTPDGYRKALKKAAADVGIEYNVGTHSTRKTFGMMSRMLHPGDYDSMELLREIFNHTDTKTTGHYIGLTKQKIDRYYDDMGEFFNDYIVGGKEYQEAAETPIVSLDINDLRDVIKTAYKAGMDNSGNPDGMIHVETINDIMKMVEELMK